MNIVKGILFTDEIISHRAYKIITELIQVTFASLGHSTRSKLYISFSLEKNVKVLEQNSSKRNIYALR